MFMRLEPKISSVSSVATTFWCRKILQNLILCLRFAPEKTRIRPSRMLRSARSPDGLLSTPPERFTSAVDKTRLFTRFVHENNFVLFLNGPSRPLFCLFSSFSHYNFNDTNWKKHRCVLGNQTRGRRMVGADNTTELWWPPIVVTDFYAKIGKHDVTNEILFC